MLLGYISVKLLKVMTATLYVQFAESSWCWKPIFTFWKPQDLYCVTLYEIIYFQLPSDKLFDVTKV